MRYSIALLAMFVLVGSNALADTKVKSPYYILYQLIDRDYRYDAFETKTIAQSAAKKHVDELAKKGIYIIIASRDRDDPWIKARDELKAKNILVADSVPNAVHGKTYVKWFNKHVFAAVQAKHKLDLPRPSGKPRFGKHILYLVDASGSTLDTFSFMILELKSSITKLSDAQSYLVIFYQGDKLIKAEPQRMAAATSKHKAATLRWIESGALAPSGSSDPSSGFEMAFAYEPDLIFWLTDGLGRGRDAVDHVKLLRQLKSLHRTYGTKMNTILFLKGRDDKIIQQCATVTGGLHFFVDARLIGITYKGEN